MDGRALCTLKDLDEALDATELGTLISQDIFFLTGVDLPDLHDAEQMAFHSPMCALDGARCEAAQGRVVGNTMEELKWEVETRMHATLAPCPNAGSREHLMLAAAAALTASEEATHPRYRTETWAITNAVVRSGLAPQVRPGLWERLGPCAITTFLELAQEHHHPDAAPLVERCRTALDSLREEVRNAAGDKLAGEGALWWVVLPRWDALRHIQPGHRGSTRMHVVVHAPLQEALPMPNGDVLLTWQVPASYVTCLDISGGAWRAMPVSDDRAADVMVLRALAGSDLSDPSHLPVLAQALAAATA